MYSSEIIYAKLERIRGGSRNSGEGGCVDFFFKGMGRLKVPSGSREHPGWGLVGEAPGSSGILVNLGVKFNHIISPHG